MMEDNKKLEVLAALEAVLKFDKEQAELFTRLLETGKRKASPEQLNNLEYYKLEIIAASIICVLAGALIGYVYAMLDIIMSFNIYLSVIIVGLMLFAGMWLYFRHEADKGLTKGVANIEIAWHERMIDELRQKNIKSKGEYIEKTKKVDEIEALMATKEGHQ